MEGVSGALMGTTEILNTGSESVFIGIVFPTAAPFVLATIQLNVSITLAALVTTRAAKTATNLKVEVHSLTGDFRATNVLVCVVVVNVVKLMVRGVVGFLRKELAK